MTTGEVVSAIIGGGGVILALITVVVTSRRNQRCDIASDESFRADMKYLVRGMDDLRADMKSQGRQIQGHERRIVRLETMHNINDEQ